MDNTPGPHPHRELSEWLDKHESAHGGYAMVKAAVVGRDLTEEEQYAINLLPDAVAFASRETLLNMCDARTLIGLMGVALDISEELLERLHPIED